MRRREFSSRYEGNSKDDKEKNGRQKNQKVVFGFAEIYEVQSPMTGFQKIKSVKKYNTEKAK